MSGLLGHFWTRNRLGRCSMHIEEKADEIKARSEHTTEITETPYARRHLEIVRSQSDETVNFTLFECYGVCMLLEGHHFQHLL
jgi:hypothetical protein